MKNQQLENRDDAELKPKSLMKWAYLALVVAGSWKLFGFRTFPPFATFRGLAPRGCHKSQAQDLVVLGLPGR
jgi:hypothetical protein